MATGTALVGHSNIDLVTMGLDTEAAARLGEALSAEFATLCRGVDVGAAQRCDHERSTAEAHGNRAFLRPCCVHLAGPDLARGLADCRADEAAARGFNGDIGLCADRWRDKVAQHPCAALLGRRVARKTLLAVAGLVGVHDGIGTTDRVAAAWRWGAVHRGLAGALGDLVAWRGMPASEPSPSEVKAALDGVVAEVVEAFRRNIGLWR